MHPITNKSPINTLVSFTLLSVFLVINNAQAELNYAVKKRSYNSYIVPGHIDYLIIAANGKLIRSQTVNYSPSLSQRRWKFGSKFSFFYPKIFHKVVLLNLPGIQTSQKTT
ncbi:MAG: hypothetical protein QM479_11485 [Pseudomonadota bacterium]